MLLDEDMCDQWGLIYRDHNAHPDKMREVLSKKPTKALAKVYIDIYGR
jgi:hypothetical protein